MEDYVRRKPIVEEGVERRGSGVVMCTVRVHR